MDVVTDSNFIITGSQGQWHNAGRERGLAMSDAIAKPAESAPRTISVPEAGRWLGLGRNAAYEAARRGEIPVLRFGKRIRVSVVALERMLAR